MPRRTEAGRALGRRLKYRAKYWRALVRRGAPSQVDLDVKLIVAADNRGWILDRFAQESARGFGPGARVIYTDSAAQAPDQPTARVAFYTHTKLFLNALRRGDLRSCRSVVLVTHLAPDPEVVDEVAFGLRHADRVICMNSATRVLLQRLGVPASSVVVQPGAADPSVFVPDRSRRSRRALLSSAYYARKSPELLMRAVEQCPDQRFRLVGRGWREFPAFAALSRLENFEYIEAEYDDYPALYNECDVFLSLAVLEGGPVPLLEAMMCDLPAVATRTGFCPDVISDGVNGYVVEPDIEPRALADVIERTRCLRDIRATVLRYSWESFSSCFNRLIRDLTDRDREPWYNRGR